jgi:F-type H+-transporting ATPase subunit a
MQDDMNRILSKKNLFLFIIILSCGLFYKPLWAGDPDVVEQSNVNIDSLAKEAKEAHTAKEFNAGKMILDHVKDAHEIHFLTLHEHEPNEHHLSLHLPVIMYSEKGLDVFSSGKFKNEFTHEEQAYVSDKTGISYMMDEEGHIIAEDGTKLWDLSITKNVAGMFVGILIMFLIFFSIAKAYKNRKTQAPKGLQSFLEPLILFIRDEIAKPSIGRHYERYLPFLLSVFFFILINNLLGLIPFLGGLNVTGNIAVTLVLATFTFIITTFSANANYWKHIVAAPGAPLWLLPLLIPIEILGVFLKPFILMLRLFANITAGHIIILAFFSLIFIFNDLYGPVAGYGVSLLSLAFTIFMNCLELLVAFLQAYVFTLLSALYFGSAVEEHHAGEHH